MAENDHPKRTITYTKAKLTEILAAKLEEKRAKIEAERQKVVDRNEAMVARLVEAIGESPKLLVMLTGSLKRDLNLDLGSDGFVEAVRNQWASYEDQKKDRDLEALERIHRVYSNADDDTFELSPGDDAYFYL